MNFNVNTTIADSRLSIVGRSILCALVEHLSEFFKYSLSARFKIVQSKSVSVLKGTMNGFEYKSFRLRNVMKM